LLVEIRAGQEKAARPAPVEDGDPEIGQWRDQRDEPLPPFPAGAAIRRSLLPSEIVRIKPMQAIKFDRVVVTRRMQHHAVRRRARLFVADLGVAHELSMVIDGSPPVGAVPNEFATGASRRPSTSWKRHCFVASEKDRAAVRRSGFGRPARLRSCFIGGRPFLPSPPPIPQATERSIQSFTAISSGIDENLR
jgi:hypothetical protein